MKLSGGAEPSSIFNVWGLEYGIRRTHLAGSLTWDHFRFSAHNPRRSVSSQDSPKASNTYDLVNFPLKGSWYALKKKKKTRWQVSTSMNHEQVLNSELPDMILWPCVTVPPTRIQDAKLPFIFFESSGYSEENRNMTPRIGHRLWQLPGVGLQSWRLSQQPREPLMKTLLFGLCQC